MLKKYNLVSLDLYTTLKFNIYIINYTTYLNQELIIMDVYCVVQEAACELFLNDIFMLVYINFNSVDMYMLQTNDIGRPIGSVEMLRFDLEHKL